VAANAPATGKSAAPASPLPAPPPAGPAEPVGGGFQIQIGAYQTEAEAQRQLTLARERAPALLGNRAPLTQQAKQGERPIFRARYAGFARQTGAEDACNALKRLKIDCLVVKGQ
jgi:D-alanyl-D-alanine carboxypeptidase